MTVFYKNQKHIKDLSFINNDTKIDQVISFNFLGITIDEILTWAQHVDIVRKKSLQQQGSCTDLLLITNTFLVETMMIL